MSAAALHNVINTTVFTVAMNVVTYRIGCNRESEHICVSKSQCAQVKKIVQI